MRNFIKERSFHFFLFILFSFASSAGHAQLSYIQVSGEPNLTVFLDGEMKGVTTAELGGLIIEKVAPGNHLIKVVKKEFVPFEENIIVKAGEVLLYKVKPFSKLSVFITESGNEEETDKKATIQTGKLVIQSLPIEISITIPRIEGVKDLRKNKDLWMIEKLTTGDYQSTFSFNGKTIDGSFQIKPNEETRVFVNILSGEVTVKYSGEEAAKKKTENTASLNNLFQQFLAWTDVKMDQNLEVIKRSNPEMYKRFDKYGRVSGTLLYTYKKENTQTAYLGVDDDIITEISFFKNSATEDAAVELFEKYYLKFQAITPKGDFKDELNMSTLYKYYFKVINVEMNMYAEVFISKSNPKYVKLNFGKIKR
jgi:hypothetical protein